jgi:ABC-type antimicrobial peptide transport system permease subunit
VYNAQLVSVEKPDGKSETVDQIRSRLIQQGKTPQDVGRFQGYLANISTFRVDLKIPEKRILNGRTLNAEDAGKPVIVIPTNDLIRAAGLDVGNKLTYELVQGGLVGGVSFGSNPKVTFQVVGTFDAPRSFSTGTDPNSPFAPLDAFPTGRSPTTVSAVVDVEEARLGALQREMGKIPGTFVLEAKFINRVLSTLIGQFTSFPILVAALGLLVGGIVIANSVALTTMERRREIAIMKAVGLQRERVLGMLLLENALMGFIGGLLGVGIGLLGLIIMQASLVAQAGGIQINFVPYGTAFLLMLLCIGVALIAALASAWGASGEKPLTVLRYE